MNKCPNPRLASVCTRAGHLAHAITERTRWVADRQRLQNGPMVMVLVGAINVSATETVWHGMVTGNVHTITRYDYACGEVALQRGAEMGRFNLGSTVILLTSVDFLLF